MFHVSISGKDRTVTFEELKQFAELLNLDEIAPERFAWLLVLDLLIWNEFNGHEPFQVAGQIDALEHPEKSSGTKPATQFRNPPLRGLWHKHFFDAHYTINNLRNHWARDRLKQLIEEVCDPNKSTIITQAMVNELVHRLVHGAIDDRQSTGRLTGEWIIFAKYNNQNYYLCLARHDEGDEAIYSRIEALCFREFPFLKEQIGLTRRFTLTRNPLRVPRR